MAIRIQCPGCQRRIKVPERLSGQRVACPVCAEVLDVPGASGAETEEQQLGPPPPAILYPSDFATPAERLGMIALALGLASILVLCLPVVGYAAVVVSSLGLLLGLWGLVQSRFHVLRQQERLPEESALVKTNPLAHSRISFPLLGTLVSLVALLLTLLPWIIHTGTSGLKSRRVKPTRSRR